MVHVHVRNWPVNIFASNVVECSFTSYYNLKQENRPFIDQSIWFCKLPEYTNVACWGPTEL